MSRTTSPAPYGQVGCKGMSAPGASPALSRWLRGPVGTGILCMCSREVSNSESRSRGCFYTNRRVFSLTNPPHRWTRSTPTPSLPCSAHSLPPVPSSSSPPTTPTSAIALTQPLTYQLDGRPAHPSVSRDASGFFRIPHARIYGHSRSGCLRLCLPHPARSDLRVLSAYPDQSVWFGVVGELDVTAILRFPAEDQGRQRQRRAEAH